MHQENAMGSEHLCQFIAAPGTLVIKNQFLAAIQLTTKSAAGMFSDNAFHAASYGGKKWHCHRSFKRKRDVKAVGALRHYDLP